MLHTIPLTMVESRKEVDDIKELVTICKEYHIALRCELRRKELKVRTGQGRAWQCLPTHQEMGLARLGRRGLD